MFEMFYTFSIRMLAVCAILTGVIVLVGMPLGWPIPIELVMLNFGGIWLDMFLLWVLKKFRKFVKEKCEC